MNSYLEVRSCGRRIPLVDYLKGFSIFTIALMHLMSLMPSIPSPIITLSAIGGTGVHVFFLCSGIGLYTSYLHHQTGYGEFLKKRFLKIYVPYILVVILSFFLPWMYEGDAKGTALLSHIFLFKMFVPQFEESFGVQFWFVSTILQLYLLFIPMCRIKNKLGNNKLFASLFLGLSVLWWIFCYCADVGHIRIWGSFCLQYIWEFALGFVLAEALYKGGSYRIKNVYLLVLAVAGIGLQAGLAMFSDVLKVFNDIPGLVGYASLALWLSHIPFVKKLCGKLSAFSYEYFLVHMLLFMTSFYLVNPQGLLMECLLGGISMIAALALAWGYHVVLKKIRFA